MKCSSEKGLRESKKAQITLFWSVCTFAYLLSLVFTEQPLDSHESAFDFLGLVALAYLGAQSATDTAAAYQRHSPDHRSEP